MTKRQAIKLSISEIDIEVQNFIEVTGGTEETGDYLLSQLVAIVSGLSKGKQIEFMNGLINAKQEILWVR